MKNPERLIGKKVRGFEFDRSKPCKYNDIMDKFIGKIGVINYYYEYNNSFLVDFEDCNNWSYPADQIEDYLVEEENEIPTLSDGVMMLVSENNITEYKRKVFFIHKDIYYSINEIGSVESWKYAKPLESTKEEQLTAILGSSEKVSEIMELFKK